MSTSLPHIHPSLPPSNIHTHTFIHSTTHIPPKTHNTQLTPTKLTTHALTTLIYHPLPQPENILLAHPEDDVHIKLADFGLAHRLMPDVGGLATICGSPGCVCMYVFWM